MCWWVGGWVRTLVAVAGGVGIDSVGGLVAVGHLLTLQSSFLFVVGEEGEVDAWVVFVQERLRDEWVGGWVR